MLSKRIMILTNRVPYPLNDGGNMATSAMVNGYKENGWDVFLLSMNTSRHKVDEQVLSNIYQDIHFKTVNVDNAVKPLATLSNYLFSKEANHVARFKNDDYSKVLKEAILEFKPDVIQVESIYLSTYLPIIRTLTSARTILRLHNIEHQIWSRLANEAKQILKKEYLKNLTKRIKQFELKSWNEYDLLLPITEVDAYAAAEHVNAEKLYTIPFGIDVDENENIEVAKQRWVGYHIGAMDWQPNKDGIQWFLKEAIPEILQNIPEFQFYFAGRNMPDDIIVNNIAVHNLGEVPDASKFIKDKKILIVPIHSGGGIRVKVLEAMAAGKVVISTDVGIQGIDAVPDTHYLRANTATDFMLAISWCLSNKKQSEEIAQNAKQLVLKQYNQQHIAKKLSSVVLNMLKHQKA